MNELIPLIPAQIREIGVVPDDDPETFGLVAKLVTGHSLVIKCPKDSYSSIKSFVKTIDEEDPHNYKKLIRYLRSQGFKESFKNE